MRTLLSRTDRGRIIHTRDCRHAAAGQPWLWADDKTRAQVAAVVIALDYSPCRACKPLGGTP